MRDGGKPRGYVPTPAPLVDRMVAKLFERQPPTSATSVLDPGCGRGAFMEGVLRWCRANRKPVPRVVGIELDPTNVAAARKLCAPNLPVEVRHADFLDPMDETFDCIIGNPPYVPITSLSPAERAKHRSRFAAAAGRFDLYLLFFEQALRLLRPGGRLVFITPEKFAYVDTAGPLRRALASAWVEELELVDEAAFGGLVTYPAITTVAKARPRPSRVVLRDGTSRTVMLPADGSSWMPLLNGHAPRRSELTLGDACLRVSCGVATGADGVFVVKASHLPRELERFAHPTLAGRQISERGFEVDSRMLVPYSDRGALVPEAELGPLGTYLREPSRRAKLLARTCVARKPWYAFHETPPLADMLRPKLLCKDIGAKPYFVVDEEGALLPRHSVYYIVPRDPDRLRELADYLNSGDARDWLKAHCQHAANGFLRLQSHVLKELPVPPRLVAPPSRAERPLEVAG